MRSIVSVGTSEIIIRRSEFAIERSVCSNSNSTEYLDTFVILTDGADDDKNSDFGFFYKLIFWKA